MMHHSRSGWMLLLACMIGGVCAEETPRPNVSLEDLGGSVSTGVGAVRETAAGTASPPIVVLDEHHNSRIGQVEHAVMMVRLYSNYGMRDIALEGYLETDPDLDTAWYTRASGDNKPRQARVAARLLAEGEISASEFMALVYPDIRIHRTEKENEYHVKLPVVAMNAPQLYLLRLAEAKGGTISAGTMEALQAANATFKALEAKGAGQEVLEPARNSVLEILAAAQRELASVDPWIAGKYEWYDHSAFDSLDENLKHTREIQSRAEGSGAVKDASERAAMHDYIAFFTGRAGASVTMVDAAVAAARSATGNVVGMVIGAAHTNDVVSRLRERKWSFVAIRPLATADPTALRTDISFELYQRKEDGKSLYSNGFMAELALAVGAKKSPPVLWQPWLQAKAELYLVIEQVTEATLGGGGGAGTPAGPPAAPYGLPPDNGGRRWIGLDPRRVQIVSDGSAGEYYHLSREALGRLQTAGLAVGVLAQLDQHIGAVTKDRGIAASWAGAEAAPDASKRVVEATRNSGAPAAFFPVVLNYLETESSRELWVKSVLSRDAVTSSEREDAEAILLRELESARRSEGISRDRVEDESGRVRVSVETLASLGVSEVDVRQRALGSA